MTVTAEKRLYALADGSLAEEVPGGESGSLFCGQGTDLDGEAAERYEAFMAGLKGPDRIGANKAAAKSANKAAGEGDADGEGGEG